MNFYLPFEALDLARTVGAYSAARAALADARRRGAAEAALKKLGAEVVDRRVEMMRAHRKFVDWRGPPPPTPSA